MLRTKPIVIQQIIAKISSTNNTVKEATVEKKTLDNILSCTMLVEQKSKQTEPEPMSLPLNHLSQYAQYILIHFCLFYFSRQLSNEAILSVAVRQVIMGNDIGSCSVCFDFCSTNIVQLYNNHRRQPVTEPEPTSLPLNHLPISLDNVWGH